MNEIIWTKTEWQPNKRGHSPSSFRALFTYLENYETRIHQYKFAHSRFGCIMYSMSAGLVEWLGYGIKPLNTLEICCRTGKAVPWAFAIRSAKCQSKIIRAWRYCTRCVIGLVQGSIGAIFRSFPSQRKTFSLNSLSIYFILIFEILYEAYFVVLKSRYVSLITKKKLGERQPQLPLHHQTRPGIIIFD